MTDLAAFGKVIIVAGLGLAALGVLLWLAAKTGLPFGRLPGDIRIGGGRTSFYFPIVTCIVLSIILTIVLNLALRLFR